MNLISGFSFRRALMGAVGGVFAVTLATGCQKQAQSPAEGVESGNLITSQDAAADVSMGDGTNSFRVLGHSALQAGFKSGSLLRANNPAAITRLNQLAEGETLDGEVAAPDAAATTNAADLTVGFPLSLMKEHQVFGGVITAVTDTKSEELGGLKLTDLTPIHVRPSLAKDAAGNFFFVLNGCVAKCTELSVQDQLIGIPVKGIDSATGTLLLDLAPLGTELNLIQMLDPDGSFTKLKTKSAEVTAVDYSFSTLVFDVTAKMVPVDTADADIATAPETSFTIRWYLKLASAFNPAFTPRSAADGVGFFMTERALDSKVQRFSQFALGGSSSVSPQVHYFVKNVPQEFQSAFAGAFDEWNEHFEAVTGKPLLTYEFVDATDPRSKMLVPGDVRFNILEWDLVNNAPYGGLGPSIANQHTGEMLSANVLVQGPRIVEIYKKWFGVSTNAELFRENGESELADQLEAEAIRELSQIAEREMAFRARKITLTLGKKMAFRVNSQSEALEDPLAAKESFDPVPAGYTFQSYMDGYFRELVAHELGHNMGLRHNFRGNMSYKGMKEGEVSHSIMEYLNRSFRHLNRISTYDDMAIKYGYMGVRPIRTDMFCTDENVISETRPTNSPECSRDDATADPFGFFSARLKRAMDLLLNRASADAPSVALTDVEKELEAAVKGLGYYAIAAPSNFDKWTNFAAAGRPTDATKIKGFVLNELKGQLCDSGIAQVLANKVNDDARTKTLANLTALRSKAIKLGSLVKFTPAELTCGP